MSQTLEKAELPKSNITSSEKVAIKTLLWHLSYNATMAMDVGILKKKIKKNLVSVVGDGSSSKVEKGSNSENQNEAVTNPK